MPDLSLSWMNPKIFQDVHFHPCIRLKRWNVEKILSFIPPDGLFELMKYQSTMTNSNSLPFSVRYLLNIAIQYLESRIQGKCISTKWTTGYNDFAKTTFLSQTS